MANYRSANTLTPGKAIEGLEANELTVYRYPQDVGSETTPHYMMFYISERSGVTPKEQLASDKAVRALNLVEPSSQFRPETQVGPVAAAAVSGAAGAVGGASVARGVARKATSFFGLNQKTGVKVIDTTKQNLANVATTGATIAGGVAGGVAGAAVATAEGGSARDAKFLKYVVALYMNNKPRTEYNATWADEDLGALGGMASEAAGAIRGIMTGNGEGMAGRAEAALNAIKNAGGAGAAVALQNADSAMNELGLGGMGSIASAASAFSGTAVNPFKSQLFKTMNFRNFNFDYTFIPKNDYEMNQVLDIIDLFKYYMHPTLGQEKFFVSYPAEFQIEYHFKNGGRNLNLFRTSSCALTNMKVEYGGSDFISVRGTGGAPSEISLSLTFLELELLFRDRIATAGF